MSKHATTPTNMDNLVDDSWEAHLPPDPHYRRLHRGVRLDPETVWDELKAYLCMVSHSSDGWDIDLVEDLMFWHADAFVDRLETLVDECPQVGKTVVWATVEGTAAAGVDRFHVLQERVAGDLEAQGYLQRG